ncbi:zinc-ribbon domain-containing protein, partial [Thermoproteota archaeon]
MKLTPEYNLAKLYPDLAKEWHPTKNGDLSIFNVFPKSHKKVWWKCNQGHEWKA